MALHDPESTEQVNIQILKINSIFLWEHNILKKFHQIFFPQEKALALKIGRQKKIQIIDGQHVEVLTGDDEEDEEDEEYEGLFILFSCLFTFSQLFVYIFSTLCLPFLNSLFTFS